MDEMVTKGDPDRPIGNPETHTMPRVDTRLMGVDVSMPMFDQLTGLVAVAGYYYVPDRNALVRELIRDGLRARGIEPVPDFTYSDGCSGYLD